MDEKELAQSLAADIVALFETLGEHNAAQDVLRYRLAREVLRLQDDRWAAFTKREQMDIHHALRMLLKYPGLGSDERGPLTSLADEIWNRHAAISSTRSEYPPTHSYRNVFEFAPGVGRPVHDEPARGDGTQAGSEIRAFVQHVADLGLPENLDERRSVSLQALIDEARLVLAAPDTSPEDSPGPGAA